MSQKKQVVLLDGGMGRELKRMGAPFRQPEWSALALIEAPEAVEQVHQSFVDAGSVVITTNNYAVAPFHLGQERFEKQGRALTVLSGELARKVADRAGHTVQVAASIPPLYGSYRADLFDAEAAKRDYPTLLKALQPFADLWLAETMSSVAEFEAIQYALESLQQGQSAKPLWASFTLKDDWVDGGVVLRSGEKLEQAVEAVLNSSAEALLFNCSQPEFMGHAVAMVAQQLGVDADLRIGVYANAFTPRSDKAKANEETAELRHELTPEIYKTFVTQWVSQGASIVGGCCGLGPEHMAVLRQWLDAE